MLGHKIGVVFLVSTLFVLPAMAKPKKKKHPPPLLLLPQYSVTSTQSTQSTRTTQSKAYSARRMALVQEPAPEVTELKLEETVPSSHVIGFGGEFGFLSRYSDTSTNFANQNFAPGGRAYSLLPVDQLPGVFVKLSLGYFRYSDGTNLVSVNLNTFETGAAALYQLVDSKSFEIYAGVAQYVEMDLTTVSALGNSYNSPLEFRYRVGPAVDVGFKVSSDVSIFTQFEYTFTATNPVIPYAGFTAGVIYRGF
jgi:hypothetical protein